MNLRVNLIQDTEQRSASILNPKSLLRIFSIVVPLIVAVLVAFFVVGYLSVNSKLTGLQEQWKRSEPLQKRAERLKKQLEGDKLLLDEINGWKGARIDWNEQLLELQKIVPAQVQFTSLTVAQGQTVVDDETPVRNFVMTIEGKAPAATAKARIRHITNLLTRGPAFTDLVKSVSITRYATNPENKRIMDFTIRCDYNPRAFE